ncbi:ABC transporter substrate-binding protein [Marinifilum sp. JC120]|nr:ABC transporter substrate-binding protein [Marinifilum sp. JC120]
MFFSIAAARVLASELEDFKKRGVLRHLGIPYAKFVTLQQSGLDVELMQRFARHLGVRYEFVQSNWARVFGDLTGSHIYPVGDDVKLLGRAEIRGDVIATGLTILKWREKIVDYSNPTFPTQVWCIALSDSPLKSVESEKSLEVKIREVKSLLKGQLVMGKAKTCIAPELYGIDRVAARVYDFPGSLDDLAPALLKRLVDVSLIDVPNALVALSKWKGVFRVLGPVSEEQRMGVAFRKDSPELLREFNSFFAELKESGEYRGMVLKYYPGVFEYYGEFFEE